MIYLNGIFCFLSLKLSRKYDVFERGFSKQLETKTALFSLLGRKDRRTKIGNLYSCSCGCKLRESKMDKAFTQLNILNILCKLKLKSRQMNIFESETPGEFVALVIVLRFLWANHRDNGYQGTHFDITAFYLSKN